MQLSLSVSDVLLAAILSFFLTGLVLLYIRLSKLFLVTLKVEKGASDIPSIIERCCGLFPTEIFVYDGQTVRRGALIRVKTVKNKIIEGKFIGLNNENVICIVTRKSIIAYKLNNTARITVVEKS